MTDPVDRRPRVALAMATGLERALFEGQQWEHLERVADVADRLPLSDFGDDRAARLLGELDVLLTGWGCPTITDDVLAAAPRLSLIAHAAGTVKGHLTSAVWERGLVVTSAAAAGAVPVAEFTLAAILFCGKDVFRARDDHRASRGTRRMGSRLGDPRIGNRGTRIGIVGASHVGRLVIERLRPFELEVRLFDPYVTEAEASALGVQCVTLHELVAWADLVSLHAPALPSTRHMIGAAELAAMPDGAWLVNTARGWLVDPVALEGELVSGRLRAFIDTSTPEPLAPESPLYDLANVVLTPHIAGAQGNELARLSGLAIVEIERFARGQPPLYPVLADDLDRVA